MFFKEMKKNYNAPRVFKRKWHVNWTTISIIWCLH